MPAKTPEDVDRLFGEYVNAGDMDSLVDLYEPDATLIPEPGHQAVGREDIKNSFGQLFAAKPKITMNVVSTVGAGDIVALYNDWSMTLNGPDGNQEFEGKAVEVVRKQPDGTWRFVIDDPYARG